MNTAAHSNFLVPKEQSLLGLSICSCSLKSGSSGLNGNKPFSAGAVEVSRVTRKEGDAYLLQLLRFFPLLLLGAVLLISEDSTFHERCVQFKEKRSFASGAHHATHLFWECG